MKRKLAKFFALSVLLAMSAARPGWADLVLKEKCQTVCAAFGCTPAKTAACVAACEVGLPPSCPDCAVRCRALGCQPGRGLEDCAKSCESGLITRSCGMVNGCHDACSSLGCGDQSQFDDCLKVCQAGGVPACGPKHGCAVQCNALRGTTNNECESDEAVDLCISRCDATGHAACGNSDCPSSCLAQGCSTKKDLEVCLGACQATGKASCASGDDCLTRCTRTTRCWFPEQTRACIASCESGHDALCGGESCDAACAKENCDTPKLTRECVENCRTTSRAYCGGAHNCQAECNFRCDLNSAHACYKGCQATGLVLCEGKNSCMSFCTALDCPPDRVPACVAQCQLDDSVTCPAPPEKADCPSSCKKSGCETPDECNACAKDCDDSLKGRSNQSDTDRIDYSKDNTRKDAEANIDVLNFRMQESLNLLSSSMNMDDFLELARYKTGANASQLTGFLGSINAGIKIPADALFEITLNSGQVLTYPFPQELTRSAPLGGVLVYYPGSNNPGMETLTRIFNDIGRHGGIMTSMRVVEKPNPGATAAAMATVKPLLIEKLVKPMAKRLTAQVVRAEAAHAESLVKAQGVLRELSDFEKWLSAARQIISSGVDFKNVFPSRALSTPIGGGYFIGIGAPAFTDYKGNKHAGDPTQVKSRLWESEESAPLSRVPGQGRDDRMDAFLDGRGLSSEGVDRLRLQSMTSTRIQEVAKDAQSLADAARRIEPLAAALEKSALDKYLALQQKAHDAVPVETLYQKNRTEFLRAFRDAQDAGAAAAFAAMSGPKRSLKPNEIPISSGDQEKMDVLAREFADWPAKVLSYYPVDRINRFNKKAQESTLELERSFAEYGIGLAYPSQPRDNLSLTALPSSAQLKKLAQQYDQIANALLTYGETHQLDAANREDAARKTMADLTQAYGQKLRSTFMRLVSDDFLGNTSTLEDALLKDFRSYRSVNLSVIVDNATVQGDLIVLVFHYNLAVITDQGANQKFEGSTQFTFRWENGTAKLYQMSPPLIFGNSLSTAQNPVASSQGTPPSSSGSAPGGDGSASAATTGSSEVSSNTDGSAGSGFAFKTQSPTSGSGGADIFLTPQTGACSGLPCLNASGRVQSIGSCSLSALSSVPASISGTELTVAAGVCYAVQTADSHYAAILVKTLQTIPGGTVVNFDFIYQPSGSNSFQ